MFKYLVILIAIIAMALNGSAFEDRQIIYSDQILHVYNNTCIETANWQYLHINNYVDFKSGFGNLDIGNWQYVPIYVHEIEQLGNKSVLADIIY